jgi:hypothetical protein
MEPLQAATTFATLVGLLCSFRQEKSGGERLQHQQFIEWLAYHRHEELKNLICGTAGLRTEVDSLLQADHERMFEKLDQVSGILTSLLSRFDEFRGLALAIAPSAEISDQALSILRQFVNSGAEFFYYSNYGGDQFSLGVPNGEQFEVTETRFIGDDLDTLVGLGLLTVEFNSQGDPLYHITRNAVRFLKAVDEKRTN